MLSEECREILRSIMRWAVYEAEKAMRNDDHERVGEMVDVVKDIEHMCRKDTAMRMEHPDWFRA